MLQFELQQIDIGKWSEHPMVRLMLTPTLQLQLGFQHKTVSKVGSYYVLEDGLLIGLTDQDGRL